jgi:uncharacterized protein (TIGR00369 family)
MTVRNGEDELNAEMLAKVFEEYIPFNRFLGLRCLEISESGVRVELPYRPELIGNPEIPALHGGAISSTLDTTGGLAVWSRAQPKDRVSTIDLRVDYLRPGRPENLIAVARVVRLGNRVGVAELRAFHADDEERPVAAGMGVYSVKRENSDSQPVWKWRQNKMDGT